MNNHIIFKVKCNKRSQFTMTIATNSCIFYQKLSNFFVVQVSNLGMKFKTWTEKCAWTSLCLDAGPPPDM